MNGQKDVYEEDWGQYLSLRWDMHGGLGAVPELEADGLRDLMGDAVAISVMTLTKDTGNIPSLVPILPFIQSWSTFSRVVIISPVTKLSSESPSPSKSNRASHLPVPACN